MFRRGEDSHCFTEVNETLSALDQAGMGDSYPPPPPPDVAADLGNSSRAEALATLRELSAAAGLSAAQRGKYKGLYDRTLMSLEE